MLSAIPEPATRNKLHMDSNQNKLFNDSVSSQQNMQSWDGSIPHIYNILLVAKMLYNNSNGKIRTF
jgi:hypothetical protein